MSWLCTRNVIENFHTQHACDYASHAHQYLKGAHDGAPYIKQTCQPNDIDPTPVKTRGTFYTTRRIL